MPIYTPMSTDAPYEDQDARFWDWVLAGFIAAVIVGLAVWGVTAIA